VTGLGTPIATVLVPSLIAYQSTSAPNATANPGDGSTGTGNNGGTNALFNVFNALPLGMPTPANAPESLGAAFQRAVTPTLPLSGLVHRAASATVSKVNGTAQAVPDMVSVELASALAPIPETRCIPTCSTLPAFGARDAYPLNARAPLSERFGVSTAEESYSSTTQHGASGGDLLIGGDGDDILVGPTAATS
jgi:hypothetical protein